MKNNEKTRRNHIESWEIWEGFGIMQRMVESKENVSECNGIYRTNKVGGNALVPAINKKIHGEFTVISEGSRRKHKRNPKEKNTKFA